MTAGVLRFLGFEELESGRLLERLITRAHQLRSMDHEVLECVWIAGS